MEGYISWGGLKLRGWGLASAANVRQLSGQSWGTVQHWACRESPRGTTLRWARLQLLPETAHKLQMLGTRQPAVIYLALFVCSSGE
jgi:hypothetical protein